MNIKLSLTEIGLIKQALETHISDACYTKEQEKPYLELLEKIRIVEVENVKCT